MSNDPEAIRREIESTRSDLSENVNALADSVKPGNVARKQVDKVKEGVSDLKDRVLGGADDARSSVSGSAGDAGYAVKQQARGNPLAAGLVAFAVGWLLSSLLPASQAEQQGATALKEKAQPLVDQASSAAKEVAQNLKEPAQQAVESVKASASDSADTVKSEAQSTAADVKDSSQQAVSEVRSQS